MFDPARRCRVCGCTETNACVDPVHGPCWWIAADLCSHCGEPAIVAGAYDRLVQDHGIGAQGVMLEMFLWAARARAALGRVMTTDPAEFEP